MASVCTCDHEFLCVTWTEMAKDFLGLGTILNVSASGVLFAIHRYLRQGSRISLEIPAPFS